MGAFDTRNKGQSQQIFAEEYNAFLKGVQIDKADQVSQDGPDLNNNSQNSIIFVKNVSDQDVEQYHYMMIEEFIFAPDEQNPDPFKNQVSFKVNVYDQNNEVHKEAAIVILQHPIAAGKVGKAMVLGTSQVRVNIGHESHSFFQKASGSTILNSSPGGEVGSIAKASGTGEKWAFGKILDLFQQKRQFKIITLEENDIVKAIEFNDGVDGTLTYRLAMPYLIRKKKFDGGTRKGIDYIYQDFQRRTGKIIDEEEKQIIMPFYEVDDIVYASKGIMGGTGVTDTNGVPIEWLISDPAYWSIDDSEEEEPV